MNVGTKSLLFGYHLFWLHPLFVARAWHLLYGWQSATCPSSGVTTNLLDFRLWVCFFVHDLGYFGKPNMDGVEGESHPELGSWITASLFGPSWGRFVLLHSRFLAKKNNSCPSLLCHADKLSIYLTPSRLGLLLLRLSGELKEYRIRETRPENSKGWEQDKSLSMSDAEWWERVRDWCRQYAEEHKTGKPDTWTAS